MSECSYILSIGGLRWKLYITRTLSNPAFDHIFSFNMIYMRCHGKLAIVTRHIASCHSIKLRRIRQIVQFPFRSIQHWNSFAKIPTGGNFYITRFFCCRFHVLRNNYTKRFMLKHRCSLFSPMIPVIFITHFEGIKTI